jgi:cell division protein FtsQ
VILARRSFVLVGIVAVVAAGWAGYMWVRDVSLLKVKDVTIEGVSGPESGPIKRALTETAERMTTLHVDQKQLEQAVDSFPVVRSVSADAGFPNSLHIEVDAYEPVAVLKSSDGRRIAVAGDGTMLRGVGANAKLPVVAVESIPTSRNLDDRRARLLVSALAAAPKQVRPLIERAYSTAEGVRIDLREGPVLEFGSANRFAAKWAAAVRVLVDPDSSGARFIDVRLPERPAASGSAPGSDSPAEGAAADEGAAVASAATTQATDDAGAPSGTTGAATPSVDPNTQP